MVKFFQTSALWAGFSARFLRGWATQKTVTEKVFGAGVVFPPPFVDFFFFLFFFNCAPFLLFFGIGETVDLFFNPKTPFFLFFFL